MGMAVAGLALSVKAVVAGQRGGRLGWLDPAAERAGEADRVRLEPHLAILPEADHEAGILREAVQHLHGGRIHRPSVYVSGYGRLPFRDRGGSILQGVIWMRLRGIALGLAFMLSALLTGTGARGAVAPRELAFVAADRGVPQIFVVRADGSGRRRLTSAPGPSTTPVWSPDGQRIAFVRHTGDDTQIYIMNADGGSQRPLTTGPGRAASPAWSPNGQQIVFTATKNGVSQIVAMRNDGSQRRDLAPSPSDQRAPAWSPDGHLIAFLSRASLGRVDLYVIGADGQNPRQVPTPGPGVRPDVKEFTWLPDGRLAYTNPSGLAQDTVSVTTISGAEHRVLGSAYSPAWAPDGRRLAFVAFHSGAALIYVGDSAGGKSVRLTDPRLTSVRPAWSPDGRQINIKL
jgi:TolB protein